MHQCSEDGVMYTKDVIVAKLKYKISDDRLMCEVDDNKKAPSFFEKMTSKELAKTSQTKCKFSEYVQAMGPSWNTFQACDLA